ncbi:MAG: hypothetical protein WC758_08180 [Candidatus Woesearchaeota archaeon]|jgi:hypothetical protein
MKPETKEFLINKGKDWRMVTVKECGTVEIEEEPIIQKINIKNCFVEFFKEENIRDRHIVKRVLKQDENARNNKRILDIECLISKCKFIGFNQDEHNIYLKIPKDKIKNLPSPETFTRIRRELIDKAYKENDEQTLKETMPTDQRVLKYDKLKKEIIKKFYGEKKNEN